MNPVSVAAIVMSKGKAGDGRMVTVRPTSLSVCRFPVPGEQMVELGLLSFADGFDDVGEPCLRVDVVELGGFDQRVDYSGLLTGAVISENK